MLCLPRTRGMVINSRDTLCKIALHIALVSSKDVRILWSR